MQQVVAFLLKLTLYPVLFIGAWLCLAALYNALRTNASLKVSTPCKAHLITGVVAALAIWLMAPGIPDHLSTCWDWLVLACYGACAIAGGRWVWQRRNQLLGWVKTTFELE
jgi:hypothetical protein